MKDCGGCGKRLELTEFGVNRAMPDGLAPRCKECVRAYQKQRRMKLNANKPPDWKQKTKDAAAYRKAWKEAHPGYFNAKKREWFQKNKDRLRVKDAVKYAIKTGKLVRQPCSVCGAEPSEAHHPDYSRPLSVVWLCRPHHLEIHKSPNTALVS